MSRRSSYYPRQRLSPYYTVGADCVLYHAYWDETAIDHSSYANNGTVYDATFVSNGLRFFSGLSLVDAGSDVSITGMTHYEIEIWVKIDTGDTGTTLINFSSGPDIAAYYVISNLEYYINSGPDTFIYSDVDFVTSENTWYHIVISVPSFSNASFFTNAEFLLNNVSKIVLNNGGTANHAPIIQCIIGYISGGDHFSGTIGEIRIYNAVRTAEARTTSFNATKSRYGL